jgi:UDP-2-acetamido-2,6-beta-L-arabino-hexul-4-ose reductase
MFELIEQGQSGVFQPSGRAISVSEILARLQGFNALYETGDIADLSDSLDRALFNTYRSFLFPDRFPMHRPPNLDDRGVLFECLRSWGGRSQVFCSSTRPGAVRGNHFHLRKVERFVVAQGDAVIALRRLFTDDVVTFEISSARPAIVDMPTMWTHCIANAGKAPLITFFWADEIYDPKRPDTYIEPVYLRPSTQ